MGYFTELVPQMVIKSKKIGLLRLTRDAVSLKASQKKVFQTSFKQL